MSDLYKVTAERCARFDELVAQQGRSPETVRHSLVCFPPLTPWESPGYFTDMVGKLGGFGIDEFVLYWPGTWRPDARHERHVFEQITSEVIPALRAEHNTDVIDAGT